MKETYKVKCPRNIVWGDPWYMVKFEGEQIENIENEEGQEME